jgi:hypothetical protein
MTGSFYKTGGTLALDAPSYITRRADEELFQAILASEFCYILDSRQVGKSSLTAHTKRRLEEAGVAVAAMELTALGITSNTPEQWYDALLAKLGEQLGLEDALDDFWLDNERLAPLPRFMEALCRVVLERIERPVALFLDEIDVVRSLPFPTDELFAGIRELYNRRTQDPLLERLSVCLIGVAQPTDLIQDPRITPFNIGRRIELTDFTATEAAPLAQGLPDDSEQAGRLLARVLYWTGGHPYLTQRLCRAVADDRQATSPRGVDRVCEGLFFTVRARDQEHNLKFVGGQLLQHGVDRAALLDLYRQVRERRRLRDDPTNRLLGVLRLAGIVRVIEGLLRVRNRIYFRAFDRDWIEANLPNAELRRQRAAYRRGALRVALAAGVLIAALLGGGLWYWNSFVRLHEDYFNAYAKRWGSGEGVGPLSRAEVGHRAVSFKVIRHGRRRPVEAIEAVDAAERCTSHNNVGTYFKPDNRWQSTTDKECRWEFVRDDKGQLVYEKAFNVKGRLVWGLLYSPPVTGQPRRAYFVGPDGFPAPQLKSAAEIIEIEYTSNGWESMHRYYDRVHKPQPGQDGAFGRRIEYDVRGLARRIFSLDAHGRLMIDNDQVAIREGDYDERGNQIEWAYFDTAGRPTLIKDGNHKGTAKYDRSGNQIEVAYFDTAGRPTLIKDGYHKRTAKYDERGNQIEWAYFDTEGRPTIDKNDGTHRMTARFDEHGNMIESAYFDVDGQPTLHAKQGVHRTVWEYDERGNKTREAYFGSDGQPIQNRQFGIYSGTARYDTQGREIEIAAFDAKSQPMRTAEGYQRRTLAYDGLGRKIEQVDYGLDGTAGYASVRRRFNSQGNQIEAAFFDSAGHPTPVIGQSLIGYTMLRTERTPDGHEGEDLSGFDPAVWGYKYMVIIPANNLVLCLNTAMRPVATELVVTLVLRGWQGELLGIKVGDVLTHYAGEPIVGNFLAFIARRQAEPADGPSQELRVRRQGQELRFKVKPGKLGLGIQDRGVAVAGAANAVQHDNAQGHPSTPVTKETPALMGSAHETEKIVR